MSSEKKPGQENQHSIARGKQSRRKLLKTMAAGSGAVIAGKSMPDEWTKPVINSVLLPGHAVTSCYITGTMQPYNMVTDQIFNVGDPLAIPGNYQLYSFDPNFMGVMPSISVTPGITDSFNLSTVFDPVPVSSSGVNQNLAPDPDNGTIAFTPITADTDFATNVVHEITLTPDNPGLCGGPLVVTITFSRESDPG